jgi:hypothetical protein
MKIEWTQVSKDSHEIVFKTMVITLIRRELVPDSWRMLCAALSIDFHELKSTTLEDAKKEAISFAWDKTTESKDMVEEIFKSQLN